MVNHSCVCSLSPPRPHIFTKRARLLGVVKTHRLPLNAANNLMSPTPLDSASGSRLTIGPKGLRHMLEHFPFGKGSKADPQLIWNFHETEVQLRSLESAVDAKGAHTCLYHQPVALTSCQVGRS